MCGINGIAGSVLDIEKRISKMNQRSSHRGPDNSDFFSDSSIALGHNRLSIIDLSESGNQPMTSMCGEYVMVFNGEIYNFRDVAKKLGLSGLKSGTDSEVVLEGFVKKGKQILEELNGMFAFAVFHKTSETLFIARDRLGIKPLYYYFKDDILVFSSEIRSLLASGLVDRKLSKEGLADYLRYSTVHAPKTILEDVLMLEPGHYMELAADGFEVAEYWALDTHVSQESQGKSIEEIRSDVRQKLKSSVDARMMSDVPFGAFLSGGIDSSAVVALMSDEGRRKVKTFCVTFDEEEFSEAKFARKIAEKYNTEHTEIKLSPGDFLKLLPEALMSMDHPSADGPNSYVVSKVTKEAGVTMALSGLGGDELFAGYEIFPRSVELLSKKWLFSFPAGLRKIGTSMLKALKPGVASKKIAETLKQKYLELPYFYPISRLILFDSEIERLVNFELPKENEVQKFGLDNVGPGKRAFNLPFLSKVSFLEVRTYMQNVLLRDSDQMSMAHALELRVPFLDHNLVEYVFGVSDEHKFPYSPKKLLVDSLGELLPNEIVNRPKMGFVLPYEMWMKNELSAFIEENLMHLGQLSVFNEKEVFKLWNRFLKGDKAITYSRVWPLVVLAVWIKSNEIDV